MVDAPEPPGAVGSLLQKAGQYVVRYEQAFRNVVAEERYEQTTSVASSNPQVSLPVDGIRPGERMRSEVVFTMLPGAVPWNLLRDVLEVDGHVQRETGRLEPLFRASPSAGLREANAITSESERLILGPTKRTLNVPTMALACLHPDNRDAFRFERRGRARVGGQETVEIAFLEVGRPTLNQDGAGADVPIRGRFWVRESDGAVLRSRTELAFASAGPPRSNHPRDPGGAGGKHDGHDRVRGRPRPGPARAARDGRDAAVDERAGAGGDDLPARVPGGSPRRFRGAAPPRLRPRPRRGPGALLRLPPRRPGRRGRRSHEGQGTSRGPPFSRRPSRSPPPDPSSRPPAGPGSCRSAASPREAA